MFDFHVKTYIIDQSTNKIGTPYLQFRGPRPDSLHSKVQSEYIFCFSYYYYT